MQTTAREVLNYVLFVPIINAVPSGEVRSYVTPLLYLINPVIHVGTRKTIDLNVLPITTVRIL